MKGTIRHRCFISILVLSLIHVGMAFGMSSPNYAVDWGVVDNGGGLRNTPNYHLDHAIGQGAGIGVSSSREYTLYAGFYGNSTQPSMYTLTVEKVGTGTGTVSGDGIDCGSVCSKTFEQGTIIVLDATPDSYSTFDGWSGAGCRGTGYCTFMLPADTTITATFTRIPVFPTVTPGPTPTPPEVIPEPSSFYLIGLGLLGILAFGRRKRKMRK